MKREKGATEVYMFGIGYLGVATNVLNEGVRSKGKC